MSYGSADLDSESLTKKPTGGNSAHFTAVILISNTCGIGAISLPAAVAALGGWANGIAAVVICTVMNAHLSLIVWRIYMAFPGHRHYGDLIYAAFEDTSPVQQNLAYILTVVTTYGFILVATGYNLLCMGKALGWLFNGFQACLPVLMLIAATINIILQIGVRSYRSLPAILSANVVSVLVVVLVPLGYFASMGSEVTLLPGSQVLAAGGSSFPNEIQGFSTLTFILTTQYLVVEILSEMDDPKEFPKAACIQAPPFQMLFVSLAGLGGYAYLGSAATLNLPDYLPFGAELKATAIFFLFSALMGNLVNSIFMCKLFHEKFDPASSNDGSARDWMVWSTIVTSVLLFSYLTANLVPFIKEFANLLGTSFGPACCFIVPIVTYARIYNKYGEDKVPRISTAEWFLIGIWFVLSVVLMSYGTYTVLREIYKGWLTYGAPFACGCQGLWATCECSASRPGMAATCRPKK
jgi:hypothetical protein